MLKCSFWAGRPRPYIAVLTTRVIRNPRNTNKTPSRLRRTPTPPLYELPPSFAVLPLFKEGEPGGPLAVEEFPKEGEFCFVQPTATGIV